MPDLLLILLGTVVVNHLALSGQLDPEWRPAVDAHAQACRLAALSALVMLAAMLVLTSIDRWVLVPLSAQSLQLLVLVATVGGLAAIARLWILRFGIALSTKETALVMANAAVLSLAWQAASLQAPTATAVFFALSLAAAFGGLLIAFTALMARISVFAVPASLRGAPLALIIAGLGALALLGLTGLLPD